MITHLLRDKATIYAGPSFNQYGQIDTTDSAVATEKCRLLPHQRMKPGKDGFIIASDVDLWLIPATKAVIGGRINVNGIDYELIELIAGRGQSTSIQFYEGRAKRIRVN